MAEVSCETLVNGVYTEERIVVPTERDFTIDQDDLEQTASDVVQQLVFYGELFARMKAQLIRHEESLKRIYAGVAISLRETAEKTQQKLTENRLEELVLTSPAYVAAQTGLFQVREEALKAEAWWRSIQQKCEMIKVIGYRQSTEIKKLY